MRVTWPPTLHPSFVGSQANAGNLAANIVRSSNAAAAGLSSGGVSSGMCGVISETSGSSCANGKCCR